jgi:hypothetical protein
LAVLKGLEFCKIVYSQHFISAVKSLTFVTDKMCMRSLMWYVLTDDKKDNLGRARAFVPSTLKSYLKIWLGEFRTIFVTLRLVIIMRLEY